jgi:DNA replication protein DnaC
MSTDPDPIDFAGIIERMEQRNAANALREQADADRNRVDPAERERRWKADRIAALRDGRFPPILVDDLAAGEPRPTLAMRHAQTFLASAKAVLVLVGGTGAGKSFAGMWVGQEIGGSRPGYVRATSLERVGRYDREHQAWLDERTMLVLDDIGVELMDGKGAFLSLIDELVDKAWGHRQKLVITSNLGVKGPDGLVERLGRRVWSRIADVGVLGNCGSEDLRKERA